MEASSAPAAETSTNNSTVANNEIGMETVQDDLAPSSSRTSPALFIGPLANPSLALETRYVARDVKDPMAVHGSCGLYNLGNTCFMNSGIQSLASCPPLLKYFFEEFQLSDNLRGTLTGAFYLLLCKIWSGTYSLIHPRHFKELLGLYHPQFQDYRQHDCQEFLALLLDTFHEQLNQVTSDPSLPAPSIQPADTSTSDDTQGQSHLNNEDLTESAPSPVKLAAAECPEPPTRDLGSKLLCPETLPSEEDAGGASSTGDVSPRSSQGQSTLTAEAASSRSSLKRMSSLPADAVMASLISEDSNHSTVSAHSTDSEQSSAFKKLKIESDSGASTSGSVLSSVSESCCPEASHSDSYPPPSFIAPPVKDRSVADSNNSADNRGESVEMSPPSNPSAVTQGKCVRLDIASQETSLSPEGRKKPSQDKLDSSEPQLKPPRKNSSESLEPSAEPEESESGKATFRKFNNIELPPPGSGMLENQATPGHSHHGDVPVMTSSPQDSSQTNPLHFYCKETKTLNTNVLVSNYVQGSVAIDSEKFAKVDNRSQVPVTKEVNLLHEALHGLEEDKVEKALIGKTLGTTTTTNLLTMPAPAEDKGSNHSSNLRTVKTRPASNVLCKATGDPNLLNNSYEYEEEMVVGYASLVGTSLQKTGSGDLECVKPALEAVVVGVGGDKMELGSDVAVGIVSSEVEKNVQMQALSKLKNTLTKSNIREDISDKASTSESTETEDGDMEVEAEESSASEDEKEEEEDEPPSRGSMVGDNSVSLPNPARCFTAADVAAANAAWECYKSRNNSVVVDTFQGQFKSTVVCSECDNVSVTYEPFMYLSLPIPYAMERQICVVYVRPHKSTMRYMLTLHKNDKVQRLRSELQSMTSTECSDVILAEVLDNHISRLLDDNIMLRYVNDTSRTIYAFQMLPPPEAPREQTVPVVDECHMYASSTHLSSVTNKATRPLSVDIAKGDEVVAPEGCQSPLLDIDQVNAMLNSNCQGRRSRSPSGGEGMKESGKEEGEGGEAGDSSCVEDKFGTDGDGSALGPQGADPMLMGTGLWEWNSRDVFLEDPLPQVAAPPTSPTSDHSGNFPPGDMNLNVECTSEALFPQSPSSMDVEMDHIPSTSDLTSSHLWMGVGEEVSGGKGEGDAGGRTTGVMDQWQTCAICLEELMDSHLLTHQACSGMFCHTCLEMSAKHSGDLANCCPICLCPVDVSQDFVPLASSSTVKSKVRILAIPVTFRQGWSKPAGSMEEEQQNQEAPRLVCSPRLTYLSSQQDGSTLYAVVDRVVPFVEAYSLHFTDGQGLRCSRCEYSAHCTGCEVAKDGEVMLQPGDNLTVHFREAVSLEELEAKGHVSDDVSLQRLRSSDPTSIYDCFEAFTQSEVLDEHNPWYCPCCRRNQCAKKTMTVWRYPDNLIIHLKRFVYEDLSSTKIDNRVVFPHTCLDVTPFLAGPATSFNIYDLYSIVCHYGGANSGHYTGFSCHPVTQEWYNYNDETVTQQHPGDSEYDSAYILFFKRQGPQLEFNLVKEPPQLEEEEDVAAFACPVSTTTAVVPYRSPSPSPSPAEQCTVAVVTFETEGFSVVSDGDTSAANTDNGHNYDFYH